MDYKQIRIELLKEIRGDRSRNSVNSHFGFTYDKVGSWEKLSGSMGWDEFASYLKYLNISLANPLYNHANYRGAASNGQAIVRSLTKGVTPDEVAAQTGLSVHRVRRILTTFIPKVSEIFLLIDRYLYREQLIAFVHAIARKDLPSLREDSDVARAFHNLSRANPLVAMCATLLSHHLVAEKKVEPLAYIAAELGCKRSEVRNILDSLVDIAVVEKKGEHYTIDPHFHPLPETLEDQIVIAKKYLDNISGLLSLKPELYGKLGCCYYTGMVSEEARQKISDEFHRSFANIFRIFEEDNGKKEFCTALTFGVYDPTIIYRNR